MRMAWAVVAALLLPVAAMAEDTGRISIIEENDKFPQENDRHYTQGLRVAYITSDKPAGGVNAVLGDLTPMFQPEEGAVRRTSYMMGQNMYTPRVLRRYNPDPQDRPYAGWLYGGMGWMQDNNSRSLDYAELLVGVVGPWSLAEQTQDFVHSKLNVGEGLGWGKQIGNEPGAALSLEKKWRMHAALPYGHGVELIPEAGVTLGNIFTYAGAGAQVRFGRGLLADYGQAAIRPSISGADYFNADKLDGWGYALFAGVQGRAVARNILLDGNTFRDSRSVDKEVLVGDASMGISFYLPHATRLDARATYRTREFDTQEVSDVYGGVNLSIGL